MKLLRFLLKKIERGKELDQTDREFLVQEVERLIELASQVKTDKRALLNSASPSTWPSGAGTREKAMRLSALIRLLTNVKEAYGDMEVLVDDFRDEGESEVSPSDDLHIFVSKEGIIFGTYPWRHPDLITIYGSAPVKADTAAFKVGLSRTNPEDLDG